MLTLRSSFLGITLVLVCGACSSGGGPIGPGPGGALVGAACASDAMCQVRCVGGHAFPGGMCTVPCRSDFDCPAGTACMDDQGGICGVLCSAGNCAAFGPGWHCATHNDVNGGQIAVCRGD